MTPDDQWRFMTFRSRAQLVSGKRDWYRIENNSSSDATRVYIYDEIGMLGITAAEFVSDLNDIRTPEIELHLNTPGGEVFDGITITNALRDHPAKVTAIVDGAAHSAGSFILQAADHRVMNRNSEVLIHDGQALGIGDASMFRELIDRLDEASDNIASIYAERSGKGDTKSWRKAMKATTRYGAQQAVDAGLADEVAGTEAATNKWDLSIYGKVTDAPATPPAPVEETTDDWKASVEAWFNQPATASTPPGGTIPANNTSTDDDEFARRLMGA